MKRLPALRDSITQLLFLTVIFLVLSLPPPANAQAPSLCLSPTGGPSPPQECNTNPTSGEITPSCTVCGGVLFCNGNEFRGADPVLCATDPNIPGVCQTDCLPGQPDCGRWSCSPDKFPSGFVLYNGISFPVPDWVYICDSIAPACASPLCEEGAEIPVTPLACTAPSSGAQDSRPGVCASCNVTGLLSGSCATPITVSTAVSWQRWEPGEDVICSATPERHFVRRDWGGTITLDGRDTTIPFVGAKGLESEERYLTDYFEGTALYYQRLTSVDPNYTEFSGVYRKLSPRLIQDGLRREMVERAILSPSGTITNAIHDYVVSNGVFSRLLSEFDGHFPPDPATDPAAYEAWRNSEWGQLWPYVPMFTREDTPGDVLPYLGARINDTFTILQIEDPPEQLPHVARMFELSTQIQNTLLPSGR